MRQCLCGSYAINPLQRGRDDTDLGLCDACYWRTRAERLQAENERLRATVDRLPKTADGVPIVGRMEIWRVRADAVIHRFVMVTDVDTEGSDPITLCYSTREAAEKARVT